VRGCPLRPNQVSASARRAPLAERTTNNEQQRTAGTGLRRTAETRYPLPDTQMTSAARCAAAMTAHRPARVDRLDAAAVVADDDLDGEVSVHGVERVAGVVGANLMARAVAVLLVPLVGRRVSPRR
jgi:hypothetical protein